MSSNKKRDNKNPRLSSGAERDKDENGSEDSQHGMRSDDREGSSYKKRKLSVTEDNTSQVNIAKRPALSRKEIKKGTKTSGSEDSPTRAPVASVRDKKVTKPSASNVIPNSDLPTGTNKSSEVDEASNRSGPNFEDEEDGSEGTIDDPFGGNDDDELSDGSVDEDIISGSLSLELDKLCEELIEKCGNADSAKRHLGRFTRNINGNTKEAVFEKAEMFTKAKMQELYLRGGGYTYSLRENYHNLKKVARDDLRMAIFACYLASYDDLANFAAFEELFFKTRREAVINKATLSFLEGLRDAIIKETGNAKAAQAHLEQFVSEMNSNSEETISYNARRFIRERTPELKDVNPDDEMVQEYCGMGINTEDLFTCVVACFFASYKGKPELLILEEHFPKEGFPPNSCDEDETPQASAETVIAETTRPVFDEREKEPRKAEIEVICLDDDEHEDDSDEQSEPGVDGREREPRKAEIEVICLDDEEHEDKSDKKSEPGDDVSDGSLKLSDDSTKEFQETSSELMHACNFIIETNNSTEVEVLKKAEAFVDEKIEELSSLERERNDALLYEYIKLRRRITYNFPLAINIAYLASYAGNPCKFAIMQKSIIGDFPASTDEQPRASGDNVVSDISKDSPNDFDKEKEGSQGAGKEITPENVALGVIELLDIRLVQPFLGRSNDGTKEKVMKQAGLFVDSKIKELSLLEGKHNADLLEKYVNLRSKLTSDEFELALNACCLATHVHLPSEFANAEIRFFANSTIYPMNTVRGQGSFSIKQVSSQTPMDKVYVPPVLEKLSSGPVGSMGVPLASSTPLQEPMIQDDIPPAAARSRPEPNPPVDMPFYPGRGMFVMTDVFNNDLKNFRQMIVDHETAMFKEKIEESVTARCKKVKVLLGRMTEQEMVETARGFMKKRAEQLIALKSNEMRIVMLAKLYEHLLKRDVDMREYVNVCYVASFYGRPEFDAIEKNVMRTDR